MTERALLTAVLGVVCNASNYPERVQTRILGEHMEPLAAKVVDAVEAAGFRRPEPVTPETVTLAYHDEIVGEAQRQIHELEGRLAAVTPETETALGYVVLAKRPDVHRPGEFDYQPAGSVWPTAAPCENHQAYCQGTADADRLKYGDVEYVIGRIVPIEDGGEN